MNRIHQGMEYKDFEVPDGIEQISICADTGLLPRVGCPVTEEYFDVGTMPTEYCDQHFYEYDESQDEDMEIYDANATPTPDRKIRTAQTMQMAVAVTALAAMVLVVTVLAVTVPAAVISSIQMKAAEILVMMIFIITKKLSADNQ